MAAKSTVDTVRSVAEDAKKLAESLRTTAATDAKPSAKQAQAFRRLITSAEKSLAEGRKRAKEQRRTEIADLEKLIAAFDATLGTPGIPESVRKDVKTLRRRKRAQLARLAARESVDFAGILTAREVKDVDKLLTRARKEVAARKKAAALLKTVLEVADRALTIAAKAAAAM